MYTLYIYVRENTDIIMIMTCIIKLNFVFSRAESAEVERSELRRLEERVRQLEGEARQQAEEKTTAINRLTRERG